MGGGAAMRAAASKVAGIGLVAGGGGLRGVPSLPPAENLVSAASRKASRPVGAIVSSHDGVVSGSEVTAPVSVQRPSWELEDWEFTGYEEEMSLVKNDPLPRVVFGGVPTMEEAKEATLELKDVLEKVYLKSPNSIRSEGSVIVGQEPCLPMLLSNLEITESKACVTSETAASKHAFHAFKCISENPVAQNVVASIACDPNVWNAVMQNKELKNYIQSHKIAAVPPEMDLNANKSDANGDFYEQDPNNTEKPFEEDSQSGNHGTGFIRFLENVKCTVVDMFSNLSSFVQNTFGGPVAKKPADADGSDGVPSMDTTVLGSFMALAVFVVMLVVLKRP